METERLILRRFTPEDAEEYFPLMSDPEVLRYTGDKPLESVEQVREMLLNRPIRDYGVVGYGRMACIEKSSSRLIGFSGLKYLEDLKEVDVGYRFVHDAWGKGYATESARVLMDVGVREHGLKRIIGLVDKRNTGSSNVLKKLGLTFERATKIGDYPTDLDVYGWNVPA